MEKEEKITHETAKLAKEMGFNVGNDESESYNKDGSVTSAGRQNYHEICYRPTQSLLQKWIREKYKIDTGLYYWDNDSYSYKLGKIVDKKMKHLTKNIFVGSYEETLEVALEVALELIKTSKDLQVSE
jgi:hypothetical protein